MTDRFATLEIDFVQVKRKSDPEAVFTLLGADDVRTSASFSELSELPGKMLACYRRQDWPAAHERIERCQKLAGSFGLNTLYKIFVERINLFENMQLPSDWSGAFADETK